MGLEKKDALGDRKSHSAFNDTGLWQNELVRFSSLALLGAATSYLSVNIPHTEVFIEGRWIFGFMGFALLGRWRTALLLACLLAITGFHKLPLGTVFVGNMLYAIPALLVIRSVHERVLDRSHSLLRYGVAWLLLILFCYQAFTTPAVWGFIAFLRDNPIWAGVLQGWREQPFLVESLLVGVISTLAMMVVRINAALRESRRALATTLYSIGDGVIATDTQGRVTRMNPVAEQLTGWAEAAAVGKPLDEVFNIVNEATHHPVENPVARVLREGMIVGLANHTLLISKDGRRIPIADSGAPIFTPPGDITGVVLVFRDQTEERLTRRFMETRLSLIKYATNHSLDQLLTRALDKVGAFVDSPIGFYHLVGPDQRTLSRQQWSTRTREEFCQADGEKLHYNIDQAGIWADCVHEKKAVIHNDYASLPHKKGMPEGHGEVIRELVVPVMRDENVVAVLGVGNKPTEYTQKDIEVVVGLADVTWEIVRQKQTEAQREAALEALRESEKKYRLLANNTVDVIWMMSPQLTFTYVNPAIELLTGYTQEEWVGTALQEHCDAENYQLMLGVVQQALEKLPANPSITFEAVMLKKNGAPIPIEITGKVLLDQNGQVQGLQGVTRDISERRRAREERELLLTQIREQARQMEQVLTTVPAGVLLLDAKRRVLQANPTAEKELAALAGVKTGEVLTHVGDRPLAELLTSPPTKGLWHEVKVDERIFELIARPMENGPQPEHWVLVINDVTREREIRTQLQQQERLAAVGQLAAGIAHDFNNIMASIVLYAQMVARTEGLSDRNQERMVVITQQAWHATRLIEQILDFSRRAVLERQPLDLLPLLKEQVKLLERTLPEHIEIELAYGQDEYTVHADPTRIQQMLTNLAVNARDAMPEGGNLRFEIERLTQHTAIGRDIVASSPNHQKEQPEEWIRLTASDTGMGIAPEILPHIFEPFFTTKGPGEGTGLGLAQVYGIVGQHGGHIDLETQVDEGTTFAIYLPALTARPIEPAPPDVSGVPQGKDELILVVEDDAALRAGLVESLEMLNYQALEAVNGEQALEIVEKQREQIALILSDVVMPGMSGIALFSALRDHGWQTPVILLTGHLMEKELEALKDKGLNAWLLKPPSFEQLARALANALREPPRRG